MDLYVSLVCFKQKVVTLKLKLGGIWEGRVFNGGVAKIFGLLECYAFPLGIVLPAFRGNVLASGLWEELCIRNYKAGKKGV
jgi:hypothetical protein